MSTKAALSVKDTVIQQIDEWQKGKREESKGGKAPTTKTVKDAKRIGVALNAAEAGSNAKRPSKRKARGSVSQD